jgi:hypothetical protein
VPIINIEGHEEFVKQVKPSDYIIIFKAGWSLPSVAMTTIVEDSASKNKEFTYYVLDIDKYDFTEELKLYKVFTLPTVITMKGKKVNGTIIGTVTRLEFAISTRLN